MPPPLSSSTLRRLSYLSLAFASSTSATTPAAALPVPRLARGSADVWADGALAGSDEPAAPFTPARRALKRPRTRSDDGDEKRVSPRPSLRLSVRANTQKVSADSRALPALLPRQPVRVPARESRVWPRASPQLARSLASLPPNTARTQSSPPSRPLHATAMRPASAPRSLSAPRPFSTCRIARRPALDSHVRPDDAHAAFSSGTQGRERAVGDILRDEAAAVVGEQGKPAAPAPEKVEPAHSPSAAPPATSAPPKKRKSACTPRPPSPYGEINELVRHPTLYDPVLRPRFPIVLCHGLYGFDVKGPGFFRLHYWGDLLKILRGKIGAEVFVTAVPGTGSVKNRAHVLHKSLEDTQSLLNRDLNFVAHSMGGLDARYLISNIRPTLYRPRSLTTLCTPHRGSEFMAWCRANIGIGTEFEPNEVLNLRPSTSSSLDEPDDASIPLPYSLKSPILSREQVEAAKKAAEAAKKAEAAAQKVKDAASHFPGLPFNLSTSVTSYLLDLLDSPAYANLTPSFLRDAFNPSTPDRADVKYYSIAARTEKIPIWHPLWLPKLVLDGAEQARVSQGCAAPPEWRGNDGLVSIDSARWGEFLGTFDACDHWEMRGSSGLSSAEASKHAVEQVTRSEIRDSREPREGEEATQVKGSSGAENGWQWQDVYALVGKLVGVSTNGSSKKKDQPQTRASPSAAQASIPSKAPPEAAPQPGARKEHKDSDDAQGLASAAGWIIRQLPGSSIGSNAPASSSKDASPAPTTVAKPADDSPSRLSAVSSTVSSTVSSAASTVADSVVNNKAAKLLYGAPGLSSSASETEAKASKAPPEKQKFSLEKMAVALCRKLHNEGF